MPPRWRRYKRGDVGQRQKQVPRRPEDGLAQDDNGRKVGGNGSEEADIAAREDVTGVWRVSGAAGYGGDDTRRVARATYWVWADAAEVSADGDFVSRRADDDGDRCGKAAVQPAESGIHFETTGRAGMGAACDSAASWG